MRERRRRSNEPITAGGEGSIADPPLAGGGDDADSGTEDDGTPKYIEGVEDEEEDDNFTIIEILGTDSDNDGGEDRGNHDRSRNLAAARFDRLSISNTLLARQGILPAGVLDPAGTPEDRLRNVRRELVHELGNVERSSFRLFVILAFVPAVFLVASIVMVTTDRIDCSSLPTTFSVSSSSAASAAASSSSGGGGATNGTLFACWNEPRTLRNSFTTRCICDSLSTLHTATTVRTGERRMEIEKKQEEEEKREEGQTRR
jgi:hypothetical protein